ncbi:MAG TPA: DUF4395 domain-containing protein [Acidimicrobiales bacterium]|jgi:hypothetical protein|nr:DUF4395 domain-containing protein [Acidimicrobiales bacterium]
MSRIGSFPDPVNEVSARLVAAGVASLCTAILVLDQAWLLLALAYGFVARLLHGPRFSPLGLVVTRVVVPRLPVAPKDVPGPPKRFAQGIGATLSVAAVALHAAGAAGAADVLVAMILGAATLEAVFALCLGCRIFAGLMRLGVIPAETCAACADLSTGRSTAA